MELPRDHHTKLEYLYVESSNMTQIFAIPRAVTARLLGPWDSPSKNTEVGGFSSSRRPSQSMD